MSADRRTAFILAGGGSRGAYQAGCLRRLDEEGIKPDLIIGSSIGVCNSLVYATSGAEALWEFWSRTVALPRILKPSLRRNALFGNSLFSMSGLIDLVESGVDFDRCFHSETELTYVVANLSAGHEEMRGNRTETNVDRFRTISRIGYAIPVLHPLIELDGDLYADGGFLWNVPFEYAEDWGADEIFILSVVPSELPRANSLRLLPQVALRMYDILWRTLGNSSHLEKHLEGGRWNGIDVTVLEPGHETGMFDPLGMLNAYPGKSKRLLWQGYRDTDEVLRGGQPRSGRVKGSASPEPAGGGKRRSGKRASGAGAKPAHQSNGAGAAEGRFALWDAANLDRVATLYRCRTPTNLLCRCGTVAKRLRKRGIEFDEVRVPFPKSERPEVEELTGQRWVPVLVHGEEVIHDSHRILEYLDWLARESAPATGVAGAATG